jgi:hypothetical protein
MANQQTTLPPDVLFAQKASAVVKAAGLDPRAMDLERFRQMAPIVFTRAYEAIYNEIVVENANATYAHEQSANAQIIIDKLIKRTNNPALSGLKGKDVCDGSHRAIGVLVGVLFAEGQRLWLEKLQKSSGNNKKKKKIKKVKKIVEENVTESILPSNDDPGSRMLKRINHIKQQLASNDDAFVKEQSNNIVSTEELMLKEKKKIKKLKAVPQTDEEEQGESTRKNNRLRPSSAPHTRRPLYPTPVQVTDRVEQQTPEKKKNYDSNIVQPFTYDLKSGRRIWLTPEQIQALEIQRKKAMLGNIHSLPDQENENDVENENENKVKSPKRPTSAGLYRREERPASPPARTEPMWPGQSTEKSVDEWLRRMRRQKLLAEDNNQNKITPELLKPRFYHSYNKMQARDIIISIEHCHNCQAHNSTLRHDEGAYENQANSMLKNLAQIVHSCNYAVRVGVVRFKANITSKCKHSDANTRIGAFEIQIAYKGLTGESHPELLHSKLVSRNWPSKSVLEKRIKSYLSKLNIPEFAYNENMDYEGQGNDGIETYPIGSGGWNSTKLADPMWCYIPPAADTPKTTEKSEDDKNDNSKALQFIQWVYDSRNQATLPMFPLETIVQVSSISHPKGGIERYPLVGVIKGYPSNTEMSNQSIVTVKLKYHSSEISVPLHNCDYLHETSSVFESIPIELEALLLLAKSELSNDSKSIPWRLMDTEDKKEKIGNIECILLGRSSYFHQIRNLVWDLESKLSKNNGNHLEAKHPKTGDIVDLQLAYSEAQIDWVFSVFGTLANMTELEKLNEKKIVNPNSQIDVPNLDLTEVLDENTRSLQEPKSDRPKDSSRRVDVTVTDPTLSERPTSARPVSARLDASVQDVSRPESSRSKSNTPTSSRLKENNISDINASVQDVSRPESARSKSNTPTSARKEGYEDSGFEEYGDDFDEPDNDKNVSLMKDSLNDRYAALMNEDDNDDDIDYNNL